MPLIIMYIRESIRLLNTILRPVLQGWAPVLIVCLHPMGKMVPAGPMKKSVRVRQSCLMAGVSEWWFNAVSATEAIFTARTC